MFYPPHAIRTNLFENIEFQYLQGMSSSHILSVTPFNELIFGEGEMSSVSPEDFSISFISANSFPPDWGKWSLGPAGKFVGSGDWKSLISSCTSCSHSLCHYSFVFSELENIASRYYSFAIERTYNEASGDLEPSPIKQWTNNLFMFQFKWGLHYLLYSHYGIG